MDAHISCSRCEDCEGLYLSVPRINGSLSDLEDVDGFYFVRFNLGPVGLSLRRQRSFGGL